MKTVTSANIVLMLSCTGLFTVPVQIQGFAPEAATSFADVETAETMIGVDGLMAAGFTPFLQIQSVTLQANSASASFFDTINSAQQAAMELFPLSGTLSYPSVGTKYSMSNGVLASFSPVSEAAKTLKPRSFKITWNSVLPAPQ